MSTALQRLERQLVVAEILSEHPPDRYFSSGNGAKWLMTIAQGIQITQQYALACEGVLPSHGR